MSLKVTMFGGGGFRAPLVYAALLRAREELGVVEVVLHDLDDDRLRLMRAVTMGLADEYGVQPRISTTTDAEAAADGADVVFCAVRVGGLEGRVIDERVALERGVLGQETTGPGGIAKALRTIPVVDEIAKIVARRAPNAWFVNFTNPAGIVTEALRDELGDRAVGVCDSPHGLCRRVAAALGRNTGDLSFDYAGLNHLGWLTGARDGSGDRLPTLLGDDGALARLWEARLFGADWLRALRVVPNEYLAYYYFTRRIVETLRGGATRGQYLLDQQRAFYTAAAEDPAGALAAWRRGRWERSSTYLAEAGSAAAEGHDDEGELEGYGGIAVQFAQAVLTGTPTVSILNVANRGAVPFLPADAVVEVPCAVTAAGAAPLAAGSLPAHARGLMETVKEVERLTIRAARTGSADLAVQALALHPLVPSVDEARGLLEGYVSQHAALRNLFG